MLMISQPWWGTAEWALLVSGVTFLATTVASLATWRYAKYTREQVSAAFYPEIEVKLGFSAKAQIKPDNHEAYFEVELHNVHSTVDALDISYSIYLATMSSNPNLRWPYSRLKWKE